MTYIHILIPRYLNDLIFSLEGIPLRELVKKSKTVVAEGLDQVDKMSLQKHLEKVVEIIEKL